MSETKQTHTTTIQPSYEIDAAIIAARRHLAHPTTRSARRLAEAVEALAVATKFDERKRGRQ